MSLEFLSPDPTAATPPRSPLLDAAVAAGARTELRDGWQSVASFGDPGAEAAACAEAVGFADRSQLTKLELQSSAAAAAPAEWSGGEARRIDGGWRCPLQPTRELVLCEPSAAASARAEAATAGARLCDLTSSLAAISIAGPEARETIARFCAIDTRAEALPVAGFRPGSIARTPGYLLREGGDRFLILFGAAYAEYVWETVADAAATLGGRPVGLAALPEIAPEASHA
jgi:heterotetrameric sarcosine oxidase gamma subunit